MKRMKKILVAAGLILSLFTIACNKNNRSGTTPDNISGDVILQWNEVTFDALGGSENQHVLLGSRIYALVHAAMHDAVNAIHPNYESYAYEERESFAHPEVAAASSAHHVLKTLLPAKASFVDSILNKYLSSVEEHDSKTKGIALGVEAANAVLSLGHNSNGAEDPIGQPALAVKPGDYKVVAPFNFIFAPFWENSKLFSLSKKDQFRPAPPPALNSDKYAAAYNEVKDVGSLNSKSRTADQSFFAKYWYETSETGWNRIARVVTADRETGLFTTARLFALLNFAIADSYTAGWDAKLHYNFWRPFTAIQEASTDDNNETIEDKKWLPAEPTPPIHDFPSTHSALGNAAASVLTYFFGDKTFFTMKSPSAVPAGASRSFSSFTHAANENATSRVMAGIHFRFSCDAGQELGNKIGKWTVENHLQPIID
ncbi:MAG TPA: phosphatase PAP2 family protein [Flavitalea sp.]|nr:phosphatase PAP2 family protein [Flavitalea sp.]